MPTLIALAAAWMLGYAALCAIRPFGPCRRCKGDGATVTRRGTAKPCRRCQTTGLRLRVGRRIHNRASALHRAGTR
jgi:DnaJ-class molecular chaperone